MNNKLYVFLIFFILQCTCLLKVKATGIDTAQNENVILFPDRYLYLAGEKINFAAYISNTQGELSKVLYVEIITSEGIQLTSGKFFITDHTSNGSLLIPNDIISGVYYIKAYTRWMRNFGVESYFFYPIKLINPSREEYNGDISKNKKGIEPGCQEVINEQDSLYFSSNPQSLEKRENVEFSITLPKRIPDLKLTCLSIAPKACFVGSQFPNLNISNQIGNFDFLPETKGIILSGNVVDKINKKPLEFVKINLSILGSEPDFVSTISDSLGRFHFFLPFISGKNDLFLGIEDNPNALIQIVNDFCSKAVNLPQIPFSLADDERFVLNNMHKNFIVNNIFYPLENDKKTSKMERKKVPFYGTPDKILIIDEYIDLLSIEEYFYELVPNVGIKNKNGKKKFYIQENFTELKIYDPLILIDYIAVDRVDRILAASPKLISKIEIITKPYRKANTVYGGIISFITKNKDFAGIDLPSSDMFIEFGFLNQPITDSTLNDNFPNTKITFYWNHQVDFTEDQKFTFKTQLPDTPGEYQILLRGIDGSNQIYTFAKNIIIY
jgi:hypothetical protein